jgi:hypothetical protein
MKKIKLILISIITLTTFSCSKSDSETTTIEEAKSAVFGKWQKQKQSAKIYPYNTSISTDCPALSTCGQKTTLEFLVNNNYKRNTFNGNNCSNQSTTNGTYLYNATNNTLKIDNNTYEISVSNTELKLYSYSNYGCTASNPGQYQLAIHYIKIN